MTASSYIDAAWRAAPAFGLDPAQIEVLAHSENVVCDLTMRDGTHLIMRLHREGYNDLAELESEVVWVSALADYGLPVPSAITAIGAGHYTSVEVDGSVLHVGVIGWVDGSPLSGLAAAGSQELVSHYRRIGELCARIRLHDADWTPPAEFVRRRWDTEGFVGDQPLWGRFWAVGNLTDEQRELFGQAREKLRRELEALSTGPERFGLIHADLHLGNLMADDDRLTVIDFDDAGYGWFAHELAVALQPVIEEPWGEHAREALLDGYRSLHPMEEEEAALIDTFIVMRSLMIVGWLDARQELRGYAQFADRAAQAERAARRYLD